MFETAGAIVMEITKLIADAAKARAEEHAAIVARLEVATSELRAEVARLAEVLKANDAAADLAAEEKKP